VDFAPGGWRVVIKALRHERHADLAHDCTSLGWGTVADGRVQTLSIVEDLDVVEHGCSGLLTGAEVGLVDVLRLERGDATSTEPHAVRVRRSTVQAVGEGGGPSWRPAIVGRAKTKNFATARNCYRHQLLALPVIWQRA
jgi:hypothetical protein